MSTPPTPAYKLFSDGPFAGSICPMTILDRRNKTFGGVCQQLASWVLIPLGEPTEKGTAVCGKHVTPMMESLARTHNKAIVAQRILVKRDRIRRDR